MRRISVATLVVALLFPVYFMVTRAHDDFVTRDVFSCLLFEPSDDAEIGEPSKMHETSRCAAYERKGFYYTDLAWGPNKFVDPRLREDFREFVFSLSAIVPWLILSVIQLVKKRLTASET